MMLFLELALLLMVWNIHLAVGVPLPFLNEVQGGVFEATKLVLEGATEVIGQPANISDVTFYLYTSQDDVSTNHSIDASNPTKLTPAKGKIYFFIHGWTQSRDSTPWYNPLTEILLGKSPDAYVVQIDWSKPAGQNYAFAAFAAESVGNIIGNFVYKVVNDYNVPSINIVLIGHSLGSQVAGWTGKRYIEVSKTKLPRIIALDPAGPLYRLRPNNKKLNENDAEVVMVVHTDGTKFGYLHKCGTIDFFPNGGYDQPGCYVDWKNLSSMEAYLYCSHHRGYELFPVAVQYPQLFLARKCPTYQDFRNNECENTEVSLGDIETTQVGNFYLVIGDKPPYYNTSDRSEGNTKSRERKIYQQDN